MSEPTITHAMRLVATRPGRARPAEESREILPVLRALLLTRRACPKVFNHEVRGIGIFLQRFADQEPNHELAPEARQLATSLLEQHPALR